MKGTEIIDFLKDNLSTVLGAVGSVTGALLTAIFLRHDTSVKEFEKIKAGKFEEVLEILLDSGKMTYSELYKAKNFLQVAKKADEYYSEMNHEDTSKDYDFDWFIRFYEAVGNISDNTMQDLWAKILAGEISQPSSFSLKTLDVLRNIGKEDAELFLKVCQHSFMDGFNKFSLPNNKRYLKNSGIMYDDVLTLNELGLMSDNTMITFNVQIGKPSSSLFYNNHLIMIASTKNGNEMLAQINVYPFTRAGSQLASLISENTSNKFIEYGRILSEEYLNYEIKIHKISSLKGDLCNCETENLLTSEIANE